MQPTTPTTMKSITRPTAAGIITPKESRLLVDSLVGVFRHTGGSPSPRNTELYFKVSNETSSMTNLDSFSTKCWSCLRMVVLFDLLVPTIRPERITHLGSSERQRGTLKNKWLRVKSHLQVFSRFIARLSPREFSLVSIWKSCRDKWDLARDYAALYSFLMKKVVLTIHCSQSMVPLSLRHIWNKLFSNTVKHNSKVIVYFLERCLSWIYKILTLHNEFIAIVPNVMFSNIGSNRYRVSQNWIEILNQNFCLICSLKILSRELLLWCMYLGIWFIQRIIFDGVVADGTAFKDFGAGSPCNSHLWRTNPLCSFKYRSWWLCK